MSNDFIEKLKPKLSCSTLKPQYMKTDIDTIAMRLDKESGEIISVQDGGKREFWIRLLEECAHDVVLERLFGRTSLIIALVRDRIEREKSLEVRGIIQNEEEEENIDVK